MKKMVVRNEKTEVRETNYKTKNSPINLIAAVHTSHPLPQPPFKEALQADIGPHRWSVGRKARQRRRLRRISKIMNPGATQFMVFIIFKGSSQTSLKHSV